MVLALQIAFGIVLAYFILAFLPTIVSFGVIAIVLAAALAIGGLVLFWMLDNPVILGLSLLAITGYIGIRPFLPSIERYYRVKDLKRSISRREGLGYDTKALQLQLDVELSTVKAPKVEIAKPFVPIKVRLLGSAAEKEKARRKALGYPD